MPGRGRLLRCSYSVAHTRAYLFNILKCDVHADADPTLMCYFMALHNVYRVKMTMK